MTNDERFEVMWAHHHRQIDENRAVSRALDELRKEKQDFYDLLNKFHKMSFILGKLSAGLYQLISNDELKSSGYDKANFMLEEVNMFISEEFYHHETV